MIVSRDRTPDHHTKVLQERLMALRGPCVGCKGCTGLCPALIDLLTLPDLILARAHPA